MGSQKNKCRDKRGPSRELLAATTLRSLRVEEISSISGVGKTGHAKE